MNDQIEAIAYHGWGFEQSCWSVLKSLFASRQIHLSTFDRGYFGAKQTPVFTDGHYKVLLTHSYGLHLCPHEQLRQANLLVIASGFMDFHPHNDRDKRRSQRILQQMIQECRQHPETVLSTFKTRCADPSASQIPLDLDRDLLVKDLQDLSTSCLNMQAIKTVPHSLIFHGATDRIVPCLKGQEIFAHLMDNAAYFEIENAGHALPFSHPKDLWQILSSHLDRILADI